MNDLTKSQELINTDGIGQESLDADATTIAQYVDDGDQSGFGDYPNGRYSQARGFPNQRPPIEDWNNMDNMESFQENIGADSDYEYYDEYDADGEEDDDYDEYDDDSDYEYFFADADEGIDDEDEYLDEDEDYEYFEARGRRKKRRSKRKARRSKRKSRRSTRKTKRTAKRTKRQTSKKRKAVGRKKRRSSRKQKRIVKRIKKAERKGKTKRISRLRKRSSRKKSRTAKRIKRIQTKGTVGQRIGRGAKVAGLAPSRVAYLGLLRINGLGLASQLNDLRQNDPKKFNEVLAKWYRFGGDRNKLKKAINKGSKKRPILAKLRKGRGADGSEFDVFEFCASCPSFSFDGDNSEYYNLTGGEVAGLITAATPIVVAMTKIIGKKPPKTDSATMKNLADDARAMAPDFQAGLKYESENPIPESDRDQEGWPMWAKAALIGGGALLLIGTIYMIIKKRKK